MESYCSISNTLVATTDVRLGFLYTSSVQHRGFLTDLHIVELLVWHPVKRLLRLTEARVTALTAGRHHDGAEEGGDEELSLPRTHVAARILHLHRGRQQRHWGAALGNDIQRVI